MFQFLWGERIGRCRAVKCSQKQSFLVWEFLDVLKLPGANGRLDRIYRGVNEDLGLEKPANFQDRVSIYTESLQTCLTIFLELPGARLEKDVYVVLET